MRTEIHEWPVEVWAAGAALAGSLAIPERARGIVLFAHGSGSSRFSPRNQRVARHLQEGEIATLLIDLLTFDEEQLDLRTAELRFDIDLLSRRVAGAIDWLTREARTSTLPIGLFGSSTGAAAALVAAAQRPDRVVAVVSRGGRPDLAGDALPKVRAATLLIVGGDDEPVLQLNRAAMQHLHTVHELRIVPGATHLFEEPGALEQVASMAREWFTRWFDAARATAHPLV